MMIGLPGRVSRRIAKMRRAVVAAVRTRALSRRAATSSEPLIDLASDIVVSLTSYGPRLQTVHLAIESIGAGSQRPCRLILWTDPGVCDDELPTHLRRLRERGLEIISSPAMYGPHTKYFPYVQSELAHRMMLVTADDDSLYPRRWLEGLAAARKDPHTIVCYRAHHVGITSDGRMAPYNSWAPVEETRPSRLHFATGVSGVRYPPDFLDLLREDGDAFLASCPRADDVWLHFRAVSHGYVVRQVVDRPRKFPEIADTQATALHRSNTAENANDAQIEATYDSAAICLLLASSGGVA